MDNKQIIKKVFNDAFDSEKMKHEILLKYERKEKKKMIKIVKYAIVPVCLVLVTFLGISFNKEKNVLKENLGVMKVYAYTMTENGKLEKKELKDNIKIGLSSYNLAMSSVPGLPIEFELDNIDYIKINVSNGNIFDWDKNTGKVKGLGSSYKLYDKKKLYFNISISTNIKIIGIKDNKEIFEKNIVISSDDNFNYSATIK